MVQITLWLVAPRNPTQGFYAHAIVVDDTLVVSDASQDQRFCDSTLVVGEPHVPFSAGVPAQMADGLALGTHCAL